MVKLNKKINNDNKKRMKRVLVFLNVRHARARSYNGSDYFYALVSGSRVAAWEENR
jgi:hypothetical protein